MDSKRKTAPGHEAVSQSQPAAREDSSNPSTVTTGAATFLRDGPCQCSACATGPWPWDDDATVPHIEAEQAAQRERELTDRSQPYMRNAHLLPPREEFDTIDWYVTALKLFEKAPAAKLKAYRFNPTVAQRRHNLHELLEWEAAQRKPRIKPRSQNLQDRRLAGWLDNTFRNVIEDVRTRPKGDWNDRLYWAGRRLGELSHLGLDETDCKQALMDASAHWDTNQTWRDRSRNTMNNGWADGIRNPVDLSKIEDRWGHEDAA